MERALPSAVDIDLWLREHHPHVVEDVRAKDVAEAKAWATENLGRTTVVRESLNRYNLAPTGRWARFGTTFCFAQQVDAAAFKMVWHS